VLRTPSARRARAFVAIAAAGLAAVSLTAATPTGVALGDNVEPMIIGGQPATQDYPFVVSLQYDAPAHGISNWHTCGGGLIAPGMVVTAAHCVQDPPAGMTQAAREELATSFGMSLETLAVPIKDKQFFVRYGSNNRTEGGVTARVVGIKVLKNWKWRLGPTGEMADAAVLKLDTADPTIQPIPIADTAGKPGTKVRQLGWGMWTPDERPPLPVYLQQLDAKLVAPTPKACGETTDVSSVSDICVASVNGSAGFCYGDSGTVVPRMNNKRWYGIGVVSRGGNVPCGTGNVVLTDLTFYRAELWDMMRTPFEPLPSSMLKTGPVQARPTVAPLKAPAPEQLPEPTQPFERP